MIISIDFDDVLVDTFPQFLEFYNREYGESFQPEDFSHHKFDLILKLSRQQKHERLGAFHQSRVQDLIQPMSNAKEVIAQLARQHTLHIVTGRPVEFTSQTLEVVERCFPETFQGVHFCSKDQGLTYHRPKHLVCQELGATVHIDDHPGIIADCAQRDIRSYLFDRRWNRSRPDGNLITRVHSWNTIAQLLKES